MTRAVRVLGAAATAAVLVVGLLAVARPPEAIVLRGDHLAVTLPGRPWSVTGEDEVVHYRGPDGRVLARVRAPAVYREGACGGTSRAFVGFLPAAEAAPAAAARSLSRTWADAVGLDPVAGVPLGRGARHGAEVAGGGFRVDVVVQVPPGPCAPDRAMVTVVSLAAGSSAASLVLVRDLDVEGALPGAAAEEILASLRPAAPAPGPSQSLRSRT